MGRGKRKNKVSTVFFPFCPGIPWGTVGNIIQPALQSTVWENIVLGKDTAIICPGLLLEALISISLIDILSNYQIKIDRAIFPKYYEDLFPLFGMNYKLYCEPGDVFSEMDRIHEAVRSYPVPIFMDGNNTIYFNSLFNYGQIYSARNSKKLKNKVPFWRQIFNNSCHQDYIPRLLDIDPYIINEKLKESMALIGANPDKEFIIFDTTTMNRTTHGSVMKNREYTDEEIFQIAKSVKENNKQCLLICDKYKGYFIDKDIFVIDPWYKMNVVNWMSIVTNASAIISGDPNVFAVGAIFGKLEKILCTSKPILAGWHLEYAKAIAKNKRFNYKYAYDMTINDMIIETYEKYSCVI